MQLQTADLLFYKGKSFISKLIEIGTNSKYSHVALVMNEFHLIETDWKFPVRMNHIAYKKNDYDLYRFSNITYTQQLMIVDYMQNALNTPYDYKEIFAFVLYKLFGLKTHGNKKKYTCAELIYEAFNYAGIDLLNGKQNKLISPQDLISDYLVNLN